DVVWSLVEDQAKEKGVTLRQFAESMSGEDTLNAWEAVVGATVDFFDDQERVRMRKVISLLKQTTETIQAKGEAGLEKVEQLLADQNITDSVSSSPV
ncbi:unnamed protein product, partial [marine sediment metagenome]